MTAEQVDVVVVDGGAAMTRIAVVQPALELGQVERNLERIEDLVRDAHREHSPAVIVVPEGMTSPNVYARVIRSVPRPVDGQPLQLLVRLARELDCVLAGGFLAVRGRHTYGTFVLAEPDGSLHLHDKDIPTAWEQHFYRGGDDEGVTDCRALETTVGLMSGWEWARSRTAARVRAAGAGLVIGGMCWPSLPLNWADAPVIGRPLRWWLHREHAIWRSQAAALPGEVARITGAPVAHASHVGPVIGETPLGGGIPWRTEMLGESQICDRDGTVLARLTLEDGEGHVSAEVRLATPEPQAQVPARYWIPELTLTSKAAWHTMNAHGAAAYRVRHARGGFEWQQWPACDLPDESRPVVPSSAPAATSS
ncbi:MAG TPA: carbon-nitrogen hydrolase family protein [Solirubrobacteraceae bacterium]|nr:carbon-nitrogen hydrolase family protein [Solirubrobacteraceae bacterium]